MKVLSLILIMVGLSACGPSAVFIATGPAGATGSSGVDGSSCSATTLPVGSSVAPNGGTLVACTNGTSSVVLNGAIGAQGISGENGLNGSSCSVSMLAVGSVVAPNGGSLITCSDGTSNVVLNGAVGSQGIAGLQGIPGTPGTVIEPIQFCQGFTQSYPSVFAENGLLINGIMYGIYSANGGFMAELPPGQYSSNGINASCTFTINANGTVSP
jgi:hypothetical protein